MRWAPRLLITLAIVSALAYIWQNRDIPAFGSLQDDAVYMLSARSISVDNGYRLTHLPGEPFQTKYPPLYPVALAAIWWLQSGLTETLNGIALLGAVAYLVIVILSYRLFRLYGFGNNTAMLLAAIVAANGVILHLSVTAMTELPFTALLLGTILASEIAVTRTWRWALIAGILAALAYLTRTAALPLAATVPAIYILRGHRRHAFAFVAGILPAIIGWQIWLAAHPSNAHDWVTLFYTDYVGMERAAVGWNNIGEVLYVNLDTLLTGLGNLAVFLIGYSAFGHHVARLIAFAALMGTYRLCRETKCWNYAAYAVAYCLLLIFWHYPPNERFTVPLLPLLIAGLWTEASHFARLIQFTWRSNAIAAAFGAAALAFFACFFVWSSVEARAVELPSAAAFARRTTNDLRRAFTETSNRTPADAVILSDNDGLLHLYTGRRSYRSVVPPYLFYPMDNASIQKWIGGTPDAAGEPWNYALVTSSDWGHSLGESERKQVRERLQSRADLSVIYKDDFATLYRRINH
jgi:hypothetical protein